MNADSFNFIIGEMPDGKPINFIHQESQSDSKDRFRFEDLSDNEISNHETLFRRELEILGIGDVDEIISKYDVIADTFNITKNIIPAGEVTFKGMHIDNVDRKLLMQRPATLFPNSILSQILGNQPPSPFGVNFSSDYGRDLATAILSPKEDFGNISPSPHLYIRLKEEPELCIEYNYPWCEPIVRKFQSESFNVLDVKKQPWSIPVLSEYSISWASVYREMCNLAERIADMHDAGGIHGDLKPSNLLVLEDGIHAIDSINYEAGQLAPLSTVGWTAPEAYMGQPVSSAMDVYSMALLFLKLLPGTVFGKISEFISPIGGNDSKTYRFFENPGIYLDFNSDWKELCEISRESKNLLRDTLASALSYDPHERPSMRDLADVCKESLKPNFEYDGSSHLGTYRINLKFDDDTGNYIIESPSVISTIFNPFD